MLAASVLVTVSAEVGTRIVTDYFGQLYPNLWILVIAPSGSYKTTALNKGAQFAKNKSKQIQQELFGPLERSGALRDRALVEFMADPFVAPSQRRALRRLAPDVLSGEKAPRFTDIQAIRQQLQTDYRRLRSRNPGEAMEVLRRVDRLDGIMDDLLGEMSSDARRAWRRQLGVHASDTHGNWLP